MDPKDIIQGGRASRRGRAQFASGRPANKYAAKPPAKKEDSDDVRVGREGRTHRALPRPSPNLPTVISPPPDPSLLPQDW